MNYPLTNECHKLTASFKFKQTDHRRRVETSQEIASLLDIAATSVALPGNTTGEWTYKHGIIIKAVARIVAQAQLQMTISLPINKLIYYRRWFV